MQWLIDLIIETIGVPPVYVYRGDPAAYDFRVGDFIQDGVWRDLDLSGILPAGIRAVHCHANVANAQLGKSVMFRTKGQVNTHNYVDFFTQVAGLLFPEDFIIYTDADQKIEYYVEPGFFVLEFLVRGWFK